MADYEFRYSPLTGRLTGKQMIEQTEQAINQLSSLVDSAAGQVEIISTLANEANENAATALETAEEALATTGRTYITVSTQTDASNYYDSQLIYIADSTSTNIPVADTGMLEVKTNDNKTACEQVFIADSSGDAYYRNGEITAETVGDVTTYTVTWGGWSSQPASQTYVQQELTNYAPLASLDNYLPLSGGTVSGDLTVSGGITGNLTGNVTGNASENLPLAGGVVTGAIVGNPLTLTGDDGNGNTNSLVINANGTMSLDGNDITPQTKTAKIGNAVTLSNITQKTLVSFDIGVGTWLVIGTAEFANNATGYRSLWFSDSDNGLWITTSALTQTGSYSGGSLFIQVSYILNVPSPKTYYLVGRQASGGNLTATGRVEVVRLSSIT